MIRSFRHKGLNELWLTGKSAKIDAKLQWRIKRRLDALNVADTVETMKLPGFDFHALRGFDPVRYTVHVNGPWCITFSFDEKDAFDVDFEQHH